MIGVWSHRGFTAIAGVIGALALLTTTGCDESPSAAPESQSEPGDPTRLEQGLIAIDTWLERGKPLEAETIAVRLAEQFPNDAAIQAVHGRTLIILASMHQQANNLDDARRTRSQAHQRYQSALAIPYSASTTTDPQRARLFHEAGLAAQAVRESEIALDCFLQAAKRNPTNPQHAIFAGNVLAQLKKAEKARVQFERATIIDPQEPWGWAGLAEAYRQQGDTERALLSIRRARAIAPATLAFRVSEARLLRLSGDASAAAQLLFALDERDRVNRTVIVELAAACSVLAHHDRAAQAWELLHAHNPEDLDAILEIAGHWADAGDEAKSAHWLQLALTLGATDAAATDIRERLQSAYNK